MKKITRSLVLLLVAVALSPVIQAQITFVDYATRILKCNYIFEGTVIQSTPYSNASNDYIYTSNTIQISKVFKGNLDCGTVELITDGGKADDIIQYSAHRLALTKDETGIFACNLTNKELSSVDFYMESNGQKLEATYEEQSFISFMKDIDGTIKAYDMCAIYDSLNQIYNLTQYITGINIVDCNTLLIATGNTTIQTKAKKRETQFEFPKYKWSEYDNIIKRMIEKVSVVPLNKHGQNSIASTRMITYSMSNAGITGTGSPYYFEFDVNVADEFGGVYFQSGMVRLNYDIATFGDSVVLNNKIQVSRGTLIADTIAYDAPVPGDISPNEVQIPLAGIATPLSPFSSLPTQGVHVKMEITNCLGTGTLEFTDLFLMQSFTSFGTNSTTTSFQGYDSIDAAQTLNVPDCTAPQIYYFTPTTINGGTFQQLEIHGLGFGSTQGNGKVHLRNADNGGLKEVILDNIDSVSWSDNLIVVKLMGIDSGYNTSYPVNQFIAKGTAGSGKVRVTTDGGDDFISSSDLTIHYSIKNNRRPTNKFRTNLINPSGVGTNGYDFLVDTAIYNHPDLLGCVTKALNDWTCITGVNWQIIGSIADSLNFQPDSGSRYDYKNIIQFGTFTNDSIVAQATTYSFQCQPDFYTQEIDVVINKNVSLFVDTNPTHALPNGQGDLYSVLLHELGHAHMLNHVNDPHAIMYYRTTFSGLPANQRKIFLGSDNSAIDGGIEVMNHSVGATYTTCTITPITFKAELVCDVFTKADALTAKQNNASLFPNPTTEKLSLKISVDKSQETTLSIVDLTGRIIKQSNIRFGMGETNVSIDVADLSSGMYFCTYVSEYKTNSLKFIKE